MMELKASEYKTDRVRFGKVGIEELKKRYKIQ